MQGTVEAEIAVEKTPGYLYEVVVDLMADNQTL
jgi:hypothetical protein